MPKPSYFALVGIETLTLQELLACRARRNGLSPTDWTNPLEPEPPPSSGPSPLLNSDTTELTLVECVRTPSAGPYRTAHGSNSAPSSSFCTPPDANIRDSNLPNPLPCRVDTSRRVATPLKNYALPSFKDRSPGTSVSKRACRSLVDGTLSPLSDRVDTSRRVVTPLKECAEPVGLKPVCLSSQLCETIHASLERGGKYNPSQAVKIISTWLDWLLHDLDVDSDYFLSKVTSDPSGGPTCHRLDSTLARAIWRCKVILQEVVRETSLALKIIPDLECQSEWRDIEQSDLMVRLPSLNLLQLAVSRERRRLRDILGVLASYLRKPISDQGSYPGAEGNKYPWVAFPRVLPLMSPEWEPHHNSRTSEVELGFEFQTDIKVSWKPEPGSIGPGDERDWNGATYPQSCLGPFPHHPDTRTLIVHVPTIGREGLLLQDHYPRTEQRDADPAYSPDTADRSFSSTLRTRPERWFEPWDPIKDDKHNAEFTARDSKTSSRSLGRAEGPTIKSPPQSNETLELHDKVAVPEPREGSRGDIPITSLHFNLESTDKHTPQNCHPPAELAMAPAMESDDDIRRLPPRVEMLQECSPRLTDCTNAQSTKIKGSSHACEIRAERRCGPKRGIWDNEANDTSQDPRPCAHQHPRICDPGASAGPNMKPCPRTPSWSLVSFVRRCQRGQTPSIRVPRSWDSEANDSGIKLARVEAKEPRGSLQMDTSPTWFGAAQFKTTVGFRRNPLGSYFESVRRCLSWVILHQRFSDAYFVVSFYKMILNSGIILYDLENIDTDLLRDMTHTLEDNTADLTFKTAIKNRILRHVYEPANTFLSEFNEPVPKNFEPLRTYGSTLKNSGQRAQIEILNLNTSRHQLNIVTTKNKGQSLWGCCLPMEEYDATWRPPWSNETTMHLYNVTRKVPQPREELQIAQMFRIQQPEAVLMLIIRPRSSIEFNARDPVTVLSKNTGTPVFKLVHGSGLDPAPDPYRPTTGGPALTEEYPQTLEQSGPSVKELFGSTRTDSQLSGIGPSPSPNDVRARMSNPPAKVPNAHDVGSGNPNPSSIRSLPGKTTRKGAMCSKERIQGPPSRPFLLTTEPFSRQCLRMQDVACYDKGSHCMGDHEHQDDKTISYMSTLITSETMLSYGPELGPTMKRTMSIDAILSKRTPFRTDPGNIEDPKGPAHELSRSDSSMMRSFPEHSDIQGIVYYSKTCMVASPGPRIKDEPPSNGPFDTFMSGFSQFIARELTDALSKHVTVWDPGPRCKNKPENGIRRNVVCTSGSNRERMIELVTRNLEGLTFVNMLKKSKDGKDPYRTASWSSILLHGATEAARARMTTVTITEISFTNGNKVTEPRRDVTKPTRVPKTRKVGVTVVYGDGILEFKLNESADLFRTAKPKSIERSSRAGHSVMAVSTALVRKDKHMSRNGSPDSSSIANKEEERNYGSLLRATTVLPPSRKLQVPICTDSQDTTGEDILRMYDTKPKQGSKLSNWIQDNMHGHPSFAIARNHYKDGFQDALPMGPITQLPLQLIESTVPLYNVTKLFRAPTAHKASVPSICG
ncbi:hypothetical protein BS47DRAFT_1367637 [Hydnum rufescens UP504]|uniref:HECT domain-containing protein n=1 Tax=Hydnum rufescens UP504 TaxID=1448309 RepID=A0A9P6DK95_9AGAM|nr:hypothetical protein BS47DRAFT_1367637 [Hydnum rufescens UP504]